MNQNCCLVPEFLICCNLVSRTRKYDYLNTSELQNGTKKFMQNRAKYCVSIGKFMFMRETLFPNTKISNLNVFLEKDEQSKVSWTFSNVSKNQKHQIHLPKSHYCIELLIEYYHKWRLHSGTQTILSLLRKNVLNMCI